MNKVICHINKKLFSENHFSESKHNISAIVIDQDENIIFESVNKNDKLCLRSTFKPFQTIPVIKNKLNIKYKLLNEEIALLCASHSGEKKHISSLKKIMKKFKINLSMLQCGKHAPYSKEAKKELFKNNKPFNSLHNNCSGKHLGMIAVAKELNADLDSYTDYKNPAQQQIIKETKKLIYEEPDWIIDGCSVPSPILSFESLAKLYLKLGLKVTPELKIIANAIIKKPFYIAGTDRFDYDFINKGKGFFITKGGAEAVRGLTMKTKKYGQIALALKVDDGNQRANTPATLEILRFLNIIDGKQINSLFAKYYRPRLLNHNKIHVGKIKVRLKQDVI